MQRPLRRVKMPLSDQLQNNEEILHFSLQGLLPPEHTLVLNTTLGTLSDILVRQDQPQMVAQQQFANSEISVLMPLLEAYPYFCPYETLYASFTYGKVTESTIERCRQHLQEAQAEGVWDQEMRAMRNVLSRTRFKTRAFGIEISAILETGYILIYRQQREAR